MVGRFNRQPKAVAAPTQVFNAEATRHETVPQRLDQGRLASLVNSNRPGSADQPLGGLKVRLVKGQAIRSRCLCQSRALKAENQSGEPHKQDHPAYGDRQVDESIASQFNCLADDLII